MGNTVAKNSVITWQRCRLQPKLLNLCMYHYNGVLQYHSLDPVEELQMATEVWWLGTSPKEPPSQGSMIPNGTQILA